MPIVITLRVRQVAAGALLVAALLLALLLIHAEQTLLWDGITDVLTTGGTDAGLISGPATLDGAPL